MQMPFCDGLPVSYPCSASPDSNPRQTCTTQSTPGCGGHPNPEGYYTPSPSLVSAETFHAAHHQTTHFPPILATAIQAYPLSQIRSAGSAQVMWPTPPATTYEDFEDYTYQHSPTSRPLSVHPDTPSISSSVNSPRSWSSPDAQQLSYNQAVWRSQESTPPYSMQFSIHVNTDDRFHQQLAPSPYASSLLATNMEHNAMSPEAPGMITDIVDSAMSNRSVSPVPNNGLSNDYTFDDEETSFAPGRGDNGSDEEEAKREDEPYAQLIYKAFMSREDHAMTLQEIYQWFRENTDKANSENKGWQNSIRHNLSMNGAFVKRERLPEAGGPVTDNGEPKKTSEWLLQGWAVTEGVQSTTRYRKSNPSRRGGSNSQRLPGNHHPSARASSGRKGGNAASRTRSAASRTALRRQQYCDLAHSIRTKNTLAPEGFIGRQYVGPQSMNFTHSMEGNPVTPPEVPVGAILFEDTMHGHQVLQSGTAQGYYFEPTQPQHRHIRQPHPQSHPGPNAFKLEDITSVYQPPPVAQASDPNDPSQLTAHLPTAFSQLFTDDVGDNPARISNMGYGWNDGSHYQL
ncbi:hypothetical protein BKA67DRAFT_178763 [Truncatella angustata]|uniref:Fork-head domain-containing protein n=1 Tax=Truncatella angustata TaxID=152316 RepID=A0A9P8URV5_9PEZI|nr:uncharacterized protein BKA67DRAFT_178763 [Truncatella angustata]KAH6657061.1 hypothetical protein BKA67DRAFT_178763 [Truncatella angustata]